MRRIFVAIALSIILLTIAFGASVVYAGDWCVLDDGSHVHVACSIFYNDNNGIYNPHFHSTDDGAHDHNTPPVFSEADCIVHHAATPSQICPSGDGLQYYFIGADGTAETGPYMPNPTAGSPSFQLYSGTNPMTGKPVVIDWMSESNMYQINTFYPDNEYDIDKPYVFSVNSDNEVTHISW